MNKMTRGMLLTFLALPLMLVAAGSHVSAGESEDLTAVKEALKAAVPQSDPDSLTASPFPGMYEAVYGAQVFYISSDGRYLLQGDLFDLKTRTNLSELKRQVGRATVVNAIDPKTMIVFAAEDPKYIVNAFTDIDCGYCRKLHGEMADYNKLGITLRYLAFPRSGVGTESYHKAVSVWCAADRETAMTEAKLGATPEKRECDNPVQEHMAAARAIGVSGTPSLVLDSGRVIPGYVEPQRLLQMLEQPSSAPVAP
ncbi:Thiol:disulfide interchange protein DsbC [hydrothermal vent metagenome]|uniref:Thiol:disulfide interchange protein DsbC n=1 Tax=hydrothermal vent metagenome TaxID=652676 RepID=A0A3B1A7S5_9ZZZZ